MSPAPEPATAIRWWSDAVALMDVRLILAENLGLLPKCSGSMLPSAMYTKRQKPRIGEMTNALRFAGYAVLVAAACVAALPNNPVAVSEVSEV